MVYLYRTLVKMKVHQSRRSLIAQAFKIRYRELCNLKFRWSYFVWTCIYQVRVGMFKKNTLLLQ